MKKILSILLIIWTFIPFFTTKAQAASNERYFVVTAYYSPLPDQKYYLKGNYKAEKRLNGEWIRWASGKWVFSWMLAAPKNYRFGTKIYLEWLWVWEVSDRWWAIVNAWNRWYYHDRIDVWMWYWDEWLRRALYWGKRTIKWKILNKNSKVNLNYKRVNSPYRATKWLKKQEAIDIFKTSANSPAKVKKLQELLKELDLYKWEISWVYKDIIDSIYYYQLSQKIVKSQWSPWAWSYGPKTRKALKKTYENYLTKKDEIEKERKRKLALEKKAKEMKKKSLAKATTTVNYIWDSKFKEVSHRVRDLQKTLKNLWYFEYKDTAIYWEKTKESIIAYQIDKNIISDKDQAWAWTIWPKTKKALIQDIQKNILEEMISKDSINSKELSLILWNKI